MPKSTNADLERAKAKAIAKLRRQGGVRKEDPNAVKKSRSPESHQRVKRKLEEKVEGQGSSSTEDENRDNPPKKKKSRYLGSLDLDSPEVQKLLSAKSKHDGALTEEEQEKQQQYFDVLEKKEQMEEKMSSIMEITCTAYTCTKCKYTALSAKPTCREEGHRLVSHQAKKRFFKCMDCSSRTISINKYPTASCKNCLGQKFERVSMMKEKKGPKLPGEELNLRGDEIKYLNSLKS